MCYFLTVAVPSRRVDRIRDVFGRGFQTHATENASVKAALPAGYTARLITSGSCSCDLYTPPPGAPPADATAHLRRKYAQRGWSEAKISQALEQAESKSSKAKKATYGFRLDVLAGLEELCRSAGSVALLVHWYSGDVETERLDLGRPMRCGCDELTARAQTLGEDKLLIATVERKG